jgi:rRNA maturation endonuclease Nob1
MTEGQWLWIMAHMAVDNDEKLEKTCSKCKSEMEQEKCIHCGNKLITKTESNPQFDEELFEKLKSQAN